jgi:hypothetical protein
MLLQVQHGDQERLLRDLIDEKLPAFEHMRKLLTFRMTEFEKKEASREKEMKKRPHACEKCKKRYLRENGLARHICPVGVEEKDDEQEDGDDEE